MSSRRIKQFIYGLVFLLVLAIVGWGIYAAFLKPAPSCFDNVQNEGEAGVDCGGPCTKQCVPSGIQPVAEIGTVAVFSPIAGHVTLLAQVANPNADFAADALDYTFNLYDATGNIVATVPGTSFIFADQTKYLIVPNYAVSLPIDHAEIVFGGPHWVSAETLGLIPRFAFQNIAVSSPATGTVAAGGTVVDQDPASFKNLLVIAIFKNTNGAIAGVSDTELDGISPNQPVNFSITYPISAQNINPAAIQLVAYGMR